MAIEREPMINVVRGRPSAGVGHSPALGRVAGSSHRSRRLARLLPWIIGMVIALCWDRAAYIHLAARTPADLAALESRSWYWALRNLGDLRYAAGPLALLLVLIDLRRYSEGLNAVLRRGVYLILSAAMSGLLAEALKPVVGRLRPKDTDGWFVFAHLSTRLDTGHWNQWGVASSHAAVVFGMAFALSRMFPKGAPVFVLAAVGCGMTRILTGAHFLSDVYLGLLIGYVVAVWIGRLDERNNRGAPIAGGAPSPRHRLRESARDATNTFRGGNRGQDR